MDRVYKIYFSVSLQTQDSRNYRSFWYCMLPNNIISTNHFHLIFPISMFFLWIFIHPAFSKSSQCFPATTPVNHGRSLRRYGSFRDAWRVKWMERMTAMHSEPSTENPMRRNSCWNDWKLPKVGDFLGTWRVAGCVCFVGCFMWNGFEDEVESGDEGRNWNFFLWECFADRSLYTSTTSITAITSVHLSLGCV